MTWITRLAPLCAVFGFLQARPAAGQGYDLDAQLKWDAAKVLHYRIMGDYSGGMLILRGSQASRGGSVTDRVEVEFDWDNQGKAIVGAPTVRNFPTNVVAVGGGPEGLGCPAPRMVKPPEFATVTRVSATGNQLRIEFTSLSGEGAVPWMRNSSSSGCGDIWDPAAPISGTGSLELQFYPAMMLAMGPAAGDIVSKDGKSFVSKSVDGWSWVMTPTIVR